jgi:PAS domain-containing protein
MLAAIRQLLPAEFPAALNVAEVPRVIVGKASQESQFVWAMTPSIVQQLLSESENGVARALSTPSALVAFWQFLDDSERDQLEAHGLTTQKIDALSQTSSHDASAQLISLEAASAIAQMERKPFEVFLHTTAGDVVLEDLVPPQRLSRSDELALFLSGYTLPTDAAGWMRAFAMLTNNMRSQISLADMMRPGNPLVYVNQAFCTITGYSREEVLGRNCRVLQGANMRI